MGDKDRVSGSGGIGWAGVVVFGAFGWGALLWLGEWWEVNGATVLRWARLGGCGGVGWGGVVFGGEVVVETPVGAGCSEAGGGGVGSG